MTTLTNKIKKFPLVFLVCALFACSPQLDPKVGAVFFVKPKGDSYQLLAQERSFIDLKSPTALRSSIEELLKGPTESERAKGLKTEIPAGSRLLGIEETAQNIVLDLNENFASGGGAQSLQCRTEQLSKTLGRFALKKPILVLIEGKQVSGLSGDGWSPSF